MHTGTRNVQDIQTNTMYQKSSRMATVELLSAQTRGEVATGRTMTAGVNLYSDARRTPQNATGAVKQEETKK